MGEDVAMREGCVYEGCSREPEGDPVFIRLSINGHSHDLPARLCPGHRALLMAIDATGICFEVRDRWRDG